MTFTGFIPRYRWLVLAVATGHARARADAKVAEERPRMNGMTHMLVASGVLHTAGTLQRTVADEMGRFARRLHASRDPVVGGWTELPEG